MAAIFRDKHFLKIGRSTFLIRPGIEIFYEIILSRTVKEILAVLCFCRKFKMVAAFRDKKTNFNWAEYLPQIPWGSKILTKSLYLTQLRRHRHFCVFVENLKNQIGHRFPKEKHFFENWLEYLPQMPWQSKFRRNHSISYH